MKPLQQVRIQGNHLIRCQNASDCEDFQFSSFLGMLCFDFGESFGKLTCFAHATRTRTPLQSPWLERCKSCTPNLGYLF